MNAYRSLATMIAAGALAATAAGCNNSTPSFAPIATASPTPNIGTGATATPTAGATATPTAGATTTPTAGATATPTAGATTTPTAGATATPTAGATATPTAGATATPTAGATATPTAGATGATGATIGLTPTTTSFNAVGYQQTFVASEPGYTGNFAAASTDCSGIATFTPASAAGPSATFAATGSAAGTCHVTISDSHGGSAVETLIVTTTGGSVNARGRNH